MEIENVQSMEDAGAWETDGGMGEMSGGGRMGQAAGARRDAEIREFLEVFPEAAKDVDAIPAQVWNEVRSGRTLVGAYARYSGAQARSALAAARQNAAGAARSTGSMRSAGDGAGRRDPFLQGFLS